MAAASLGGKAARSAARARRQPSVVARHDSDARLAPDATPAYLGYDRGRRTLPRCLETVACQRRPPRFQCAPPLNGKVCHGTQLPESSISAATQLGRLAVTQ
ncbi:hypothetical protein MRX96_030656 [Rhipicephalus microplus]